MEKKKTVNGLIMHERIKEQRMMKDVFRRQSF